MKKHKNSIFYISVLTIFSIVIYFFITTGSSLNSTTIANSSIGEGSIWSDFVKNLIENIASPVAILIMQIVVILIAVRICGWICKKIGQPTVVGEIIAGVLLGPSLLGYYYPDIFNFIFPLTSLDNIKFLSQIGLILFMFIVGMELDLKTIKNRANTSAIISHVGIIVPFSLGVILAFFLQGDYTLHVKDFTSFALFMGIAMSIAAFPVMARIVHERNINKTPLGPVIITCAAIDDITAWCILAAIIAIVKAGSFGSSIFVILMAITYVIFMFKVVRPFLQRLSDVQTSKRILSKSIIGIFFIVLFISAYATEVIGIHALFGAFMAGVIMPSNMNFRNLVTAKIEDVSLVLLLPLFFVFTGLRTQIGLLNEPHMWVICLIIICLAVFGKALSTAFAARFVGNTWKDSLTIGALMNTRGLMELVVLNIGLDLGILSPEIFAMMVVMALTTTFLTSPLLNLIDRVFKKKNTEDELENQPNYKVLVSFKDSDIGRKLLYLAHCFVRRKQSQSEITMLHLSEGNMLYQSGIEEEEEEMFRPILEEANSLKQPINPVFEVTSNVHSNIAKIANKGEYDLLLLGEHESVFEHNVLGRVLNIPHKILHIPSRIMTMLFGGHRRWSGTMISKIDEGTHTIISKSDLPIGIFIDKGLLEIKTVFIPIMDEEDTFVGQFMERLAQNSYVRITLWDPINLANQSIEFVNYVNSIKSINPYLFQQWNNNIAIGSDIFFKQDLMLVSLRSWRKLEAKGFKWLKDVPSTLILVDN